MFSKNLKFYRLRKSMTKTELAEAANISAMAITNYENGERMPSMEIIHSLADVLEVRVSDFLMSESHSLVFHHAEFRKNSTLTKTQKEYLFASVEDYFSRFMTVVEILGGNVLPRAPQCKKLTLTKDDEENAQSLREALGFASEDPIDDLTGKLENKGILIYEGDIGTSRFSGLNGFVNERPYIVLNPRMTTERNRSSAGHELAHLMFEWPEDIDEKEIETRATAISGAFLFPGMAVIRELGIHRSAVTADMTMVAREYGISMMLLVKRAEQCGVFNSSTAKKFFILASQKGWRTAEPTRIPKEHPTLFEQLVYRAVNEEEISIQRGAELLRTSYDSVAAMSRYSEV